jgi:hypothetical protein
MPRAYRSGEGLVGDFTDLVARPGGANVECNPVCYLSSSSKPIASKCEPGRKCDLHCAVNPRVGGCNRSW